MSNSFFRATLHFTARDIKYWLCSICIQCVYVIYFKNVFRMKLISNCICCSIFLTFPCNFGNTIYFSVQPNIKSKRKLLPLVFAVVRWKLWILFLIRVSLIIDKAHSFFCLFLFYKVILILEAPSRCGLLFNGLVP